MDPYQNNKKAHGLSEKKKSEQYIFTHIRMYTIFYFNALCIGRVEIDPRVYYTDPLVVHRPQFKKPCPLTYRAFRLRP